MRKFPLLLGILGLLLPPLQAAEIPPLKSIMTIDDIKATGLEKLSESELEALREWIDVFSERDVKFVKRQYRTQLREAEKELAMSQRMEPKDTVDTASEAESEIARVETVNRKQGDKNSAEKDLDKIVSTIDGAFSGWTGTTRFRLANGQIWQQRKRESRYSIRTVQNPRVVIKKNFLGFYAMSLPDLKKKIPVKRLQ